VNLYDLIRKLAVPVMGDLASEIHAAIDRHEAEHNATAAAAGVAMTPPAPEAPAASTGEDPAHVVP
jgi:hypothetical protein